MRRYPLGLFPVSRIGFGAMQLPGPGVFGPPRDRAEALAVLSIDSAGGDPSAGPAVAATELPLPYPLSQLGPSS